MIVFEKDERTKFEDIRDTFSDVVCRQYDEAKTYHDGKGVMFELTDNAEFDDYMKLLAIKKIESEITIPHLLQFMKNIALHNLVDIFELFDCKVEY